MSSDAGPALGPNMLPDEVTDQVRALIETWTNDLVTGQTAAWAGFWADKAVLMPPGHQRLTGLGDITDYVTKAFKPGLRYRFSDWSFTGCDDLAVVTNQVELNGDGSDAEASTVFNQMIVLRRDADQAWHIQTVIFTPIGDLSPGSSAAQA